ncbi:MAG: D-aminoacylase [Acidobacteriota bacterium]|nr:D-aminoacylase [Acidobacteriota bacterium]
MRLHAAVLVFLSLAVPLNAYDLLIVNARVVDGTGGSWFRASIGIDGDTITAIGLLPGAAAKRTIDAQGFVVAPGFIDIHTHARTGIFQVPTADNYIRQGVTTLIEGNDGSSPIPLKPFLDKLRATPLSVNFGSFAGHGSIRAAVMGLENRHATPAEIERMKDLARQAMRDGAFGLSTGLFYVPGNYAATEEVIEIAKVVGEMGGMHISHMRDEGIHVVDSVRETIRIGEEGHLPTQVTHHKTIGKANWGKPAETIRVIEEARARGVDVSMDAYPYTASSTGTAALFPQWSQASGHKELVKRLHDPGTRAKIKAAISDNISNGRGGGSAKNIVMASCGFDATLAGKSLAQITGTGGKEPTPDNAAETAMDIQEKGGCSAVYHAIDEADVERILRYPFTMIGSDGEIPIFGKGVPHPRSYGTFARVLGRYVRERKVLTLEDAVHRMSALPADRLGLEDRGLLRPGMKADVVIFDPATVEDRATFLEPHQYAVGFREVLVNGIPVLDEGKITSSRPGRVLTK